MTVDGTDPFAAAGLSGLHDLNVCFEGAVPAVIATASSGRTPNITYLSRVRMVDESHIALSNQFFSKTSRNLAENPRASVLLIDPTTYQQYRLRVVYERTERRGPVFDQLSQDVDAAGAMHGMQDVFRLRAADIYRVTDIEITPSRAGADPKPLAGTVRASDAERTGALAKLSMRLSRCTDLDTLVGTTVTGLDELLGYQHTLLLLLDEPGTRLYTIATHGYEHEGVGSEVVVGEGIVGMAAARCAPIRLGNLRQLSKYSRSIQRSYEEEGVAPGREIPVPGLPGAQSRVAVPMMALGQLIGVLVVESGEPVAFDETDEALLTVVAALVADAIEIDRAQERSELSPPTPSPPTAEPESPEAVTHVRYFASDGSTFLDGDYLIKGVAGRILWALLGHHEREGRVEFTNREIRLDPSLELPELRDNLESRLILLKRRLDERGAPLRIEKTGRGRFRLEVDTTLRLDGQP